jgi:hypothetical protein
MSEFTIVYSAFGRRFIREAAISAWSAKRSMPDAPTYLFTNEPVDCPYFDQVIVQSGRHAGTFEDQRGKSSKATAVLECPSDTCLFLDADTYVTDSVADVFESRIRFDIAGCHDTWQFPAIYQFKSRDKQALEHSQAYPYINTGVLFFRKNENTLRFLEAWAAASDYEPNDQLAFANVLYKSDLRFHTLPSVYNARAAEPIHLSGTLKILHKFSDVEAADPQTSSAFVADFLSKTYLNRVYNPSTGEMKVVMPFFGMVDEFRQLHTLRRECVDFLYPKLIFLSNPTNGEG